MKETRTNVSKQTKRENGFTLLEVLLASIIMMIIFLGAGGYLIHSTRVRMQTRRQAAADIEANSTMEQAFWLIDNSNSAIPENGSCFLKYTDGAPAYANTDPLLTWSTDGNTYRKRVNISKETLFNANYANISVLVWHDSSDTNQFVNLATKKYLQ